AGYRSTPALAVAKAALTIALALISYYLVERPVRGLRLRPLVLAPAAITAALGVLVVTTLHATAPVDSEPATEPQVLAAAPAPRAVRLATAGDSVAKSLAPALRRIADGRGWGYVDSAVSSCSVAGLLIV